MKQGITWTRFLIIGISLLTFVASCDEGDVEYVMTVDLVYINQTDSLVQFTLKEAISFGEALELELPPKSTSEVYTYEFEGVTKEIEPESCCDDFLINVYANLNREGDSKTITFNDTLCVTHLNEKSVVISNYSYEIISERHFKYTYVFFQKDFEEAFLCE